MAFSEHSTGISTFGTPETVDCILAAGDASDLDDIRAWCAQLPANSYGTIFIEVFAPMQIETIETPRRVSVTWICREGLAGSSRPGIGVPRGQALATAVDAWLDEWVRAEPESGQHCMIWTGARSSSIMQSFWMRVERELTEAWSGHEHA